MQAVQTRFQLMLLFTYAAKLQNDSLKEAFSGHTEHLCKDNYCMLVL